MFDEVNDLFGSPHENSRYRGAQVAGSYLILLWLERTLVSRSNVTPAGGTRERCAPSGLISASFVIPGAPHEFPVHSDALAAVSDDRVMPSEGPALGPGHDNDAERAA